MGRMKRKQIYIDLDQDRQLRVLSRRQHKSASELIREGINRVLAEPPLDRAAWDREKAFIESLIRKGPVPGKRTWTREELYDDR